MMTFIRIAGGLVCIHIGVPADSDISRNVVQSIHLLQGKVWRRVLGNQDKVLHGWREREERLIETTYVDQNILPFDLSFLLSGHLSDTLPVYLEENMTTKGSLMKVSVPHGSHPSS